MTRVQLLILSVIDCAFGAVYLASDGGPKAIALGMNLALAVLLAVLTSQDLRRRGWAWQAPVIGVSYLVAPLVGLALYAYASNRPIERDPVTN